MAWQHLSPSGPVVLHLELELKEENDGETGSPVTVGEGDAVDVGLHADSFRGCS